MNNKSADGTLRYPRQKEAQCKIERTNAMQRLEKKNLRDKKQSRTPGEFECLAANGNIEDQIPTLIWV